MKSARQSQQRMIHVRLPAELHKRLRIRVAEEDPTIQHGVSRLIAADLDRLARSDHRGRFRSEVLGREEKLLEEMNAVREFRSEVADLMPLHSLRPHEEMEKIMKYEIALRRSIARNLDLLQKLQAARAKRNP